MSADPNKIISLTIKKFPQNLLLPKEENSVILQVTNLSGKEENYKVEFEGENLEISFTPEEFKNEIKFNPGEVKEISLSLKPTMDGSGKLIINIFWVKLVEYKVKVQKLRDKISVSKINKILKTKDFLTIKSKDRFRPDNFIKEASKGDINSLEKQVKIMENNKDVQGSTKVEDLDNLKRNLAMSYLSVDEFYKALEMSLKLSIEAEKVDFYYNLVRAYASKNLESTLNIAKSLGDKNKKNHLLQNLALDYPEQIQKIISLLDDENLKQKVMIDVIGKVLNNQTDLALRLTENITDEVIKVKVLFNVIKFLHSQNNTEQVLQIVKQINNIIQSSIKLDLREQNYNNPAYQFFKETICIVAELDCPEAADAIINGINVEELKQNVAKDLVDEIYIMVDEIRTKLESKTALSQYFMLNTFVSKIAPEIRDFSLVGGNVSNNLLIGDQNFSVAFISLFGFDFSIFPILDRIYMDLQANSKRTIAYYIYPSISNHEKDELGIIQKSLNQFFSPRKLSQPIIIFNLDFIPYLGKPTIILSEENNNMKAKIEKGMNQKANVLVDNSMFSGGKSLETLKQVFFGNNFKLINLILSYEFLNDFETLKLFIQSVLK